MLDTVGSSWRKLRRRLRLRPISVYTAARVRAALKGMGRLPPGELDPFETKMNTDQLFVLDRVNELGPIFKSWWGSMYTTCIVGLARGRRFLIENRDNLPLRAIRLDRVVPGGVVRAMDGEAHRHYRRVFVDALQSLPPSIYETSIREIVCQGLDALDAEAAQGPLRRAALGRIFREITSGIMLRILFGISPGSPHYKALLKEYRKYGPKVPPFRIEKEQIEAFTELKSVVGSIVEEIRSAGAEYPACLLKHVLESGSLDETALGNLIHMFEQSHFDVYSLWQWMTKYLSENPAFTAQMRESLSKEDSAAAERLGEAIALETLRLNQSEVLFRSVKSDVVFEGYFLPKGSNVRLCIWEGHKDPAVFPEPFKFDPQRFCGRTYSIDEYAPFGLDSHRCIGSDLVIRATSIFAQELTRRFEWKLIADGPAVFGEYHWEPNPEFSVAFTRVAQKDRR